VKYEPKEKYLSILPYIYESLITTYDKRGPGPKTHQVKGAAHRVETSIVEWPNDCCQHIIFTPHQRAGTFARLFYFNKVGLIM